MQKMQLNGMNKILRDTETLDWKNWRWQMKNRITSLEDLQILFPDRKIDPERLVGNGQMLRFGLTPFYLELMLRTVNSDALWRQIIPDINETLSNPGLSNDPLDEEQDSPVDGLIHRYHNRVVLLLTNRCSVYCRHCNRRRRAMDAESDAGSKIIEDWLTYLKHHPAIHEVILSGGDPLTWTDKRLADLMNALKSIPGIEIIRISSRIPVTLPFRITEEFCTSLAPFHPIYINIHINHPDEISSEFSSACDQLIRYGFVLGSQTVLLKGVNDDAATLICLFGELLKLRVKPYSLYHADPALGTAHFRTSIRKGKSLIREIINNSSGLAVPHYIVDVPGGIGKIPILPDFIVYDEDVAVVMRSLNGKKIIYRDGSQ